MINMELLEISDDDIDRVRLLLNLPEEAFDVNRLKVLKSLKNIDVAACPGSGKTTLLVAKLAILAEKWQSRTSGFCVLSHTNVARNEIETRLGNTEPGQRLLSYPHFIGTIHSFVDEFLAIPWLRAKGYPVKLIDTKVCEGKRWKKIPARIRESLEKYRKIKQNNIVLKNPNFKPEFRFNYDKEKMEFSNSSDTITSLIKALKLVTEEGYHCYDDMFMWANNLLDVVPELIDVIQNRFPLLFIDECQDNNTLQSKLLHRIFWHSNNNIIHQRFGDNNQAIFDNISKLETVMDLSLKIDAFPNEAVKMDLPNSHRFGQKIADLASPFGVSPHRPFGLKGQGPRKSLSSGSSEGQHTIFLFTSDCTEKVLPAYGDLLINTFSDQELIEGKFTVVGHIHNPYKDSTKNKPSYIGHYWPIYNAKLAFQNPKPEIFLDYFIIGKREVDLTGEFVKLIEMIADGILFLVNMSNKVKLLIPGKNKHRYILKLLDGNNKVYELYQKLIIELIGNLSSFSKKLWKENKWPEIIREIAESIALDELSSEEAQKFLRWDDEFDFTNCDNYQQNKDNIYQYPITNPGRNSNRAKNNVFACNLMISFVFGAKNNVFEQSNALYSDSWDGKTSWGSGKSSSLAPARLFDETPSTHSLSVFSVLA